MATPSLQIQAYVGGKKKIDLMFGDDYQYYDLASLTKVLFTGRALMTLFEDKKCKALTYVKDILPWWPHQMTTIQQLLTHSSGMIWWKPYYEDLKVLPENKVIRFKKLAQILKETPIEQSEKSIYSDSGFLLLGFVLEALEEKNLIEIWEQNQERWCSKNQLHFRSLFGEKLNNTKNYAPTEKTSGEVHDENSFALGGVTPHAGLFGGVTDVAEYLLVLRKILKNEIKNPVISVEILNQFLQRAVAPSQGDWTLGWMMPTIGVSSSGHYFSPTSVGHTGFTGTSMWWDLKKDIIIVILSNRVNFGRENKSFAQLRPLLHDFIIESLEV